MSIEAASRPVPISRVWSGSKIIADNLEGDDLADVLQYHADASVWWVMPRQAGPQLHDLGRGLDLDELAINDLLSADRRAKFEQLDNNRLLITSGVTLDAERARLILHPVSVVSSERVIVCLADRKPGSCDPAKWLSDAAAKLTEDGVQQALQVIVTSVIKSYQVAVEWLESACDSLADALFEERPLSKSEQLWAFKLRTMLSQLRRLTEPMRTVLSDVVDSFDDHDGVVTRQWRLIEESHQRTANAADALREALSSVFDTSLALADLRMNQVMKKLTGWAAIIAVPTLVTGFVGMNVLFPLDGTKIGFWVYLMVMIIPVVALFFVFRRRDWI